MSAFSPARRKAVADRAGHRCEYCRLPARGQVATFPIDHIEPKVSEGTNELDNLALACPHCNAHKWTSIEAVDPLTGAMVRLFNPRADVWNEHFEWNDAFSELVGKSPVGHATITALRMNDAGMVELRQLLAELGLFTEANR